MFVSICLLLLLVAAQPSAAAGPAVTFTTPAGTQSYPDHDTVGPVPYTESTTAVRTTDPRPFIGIQGTGGTQLVCHFDDVFTSQPCGSPAPGCAATVCGSFQPAAAISPDSGNGVRDHFLAVDLLDGADNVLAQVFLRIDVDTTSPVVTLNTRRGLLEDQQDNPLRPAFQYAVTDTNVVGGLVDTAACSWAPASAPAGFTPCPLRPGQNSFRPRALPARHRLYRLDIRGTDDFGRSTSATGLYDPVPCAVSLTPPASIAALVSSGIRTHLRCDAIRHVRVGVFAFMVDGRTSSSPRGAVSDHPILGEYAASARSAGTIDEVKRLKLARAVRSSVRQSHSIGLVVAAGDADKVSSGLADASLSYRAFDLRR